jgi:alpha-D-xyloside xylohydrolase
MRWEEATTTLRVGARAGRFPTMLQTRTLHIVLVREGFGVGMEPTQEPSKTIVYTGGALTVQL